MANNFNLSGRVATVNTNEKNNRIEVRIVHNFGGKKLDPLGVTFTAFKNKKGQYPAGVEGLQKGDNVIVYAMQRPNNYTNAEGDKKYRTRYIVKRVEANTDKKSVNEVEFNGRLAADATVNEAGNRCEVRFIHNFGKDMEPLGITAISLKGKNGELIGADLKKGKHYLVKAFVRSNNYTNEAGDKKYRQQLVLKSVEPIVKSEEQEATEEAIDAAEVMDLQ